MIMMQGHGQIEVWDISAPVLSQFGQLTQRAASPERCCHQQSVQNGFDYHLKL